MPERTIKERTPSEVVTAPKKDRESALRLARMLVAQGRYEGALGVYADRGADAAAADLHAAFHQSERR